MILRTFDIDRPIDLAAILPDENGMLWMRHGEGFAAWGEALRIEPGTGKGRFDGALSELWAFFSTIDSGDAAEPPMAFGTFTFDPDIPGSVLIVPKVVVWTHGEHSTLTVLGDGDPPDLDLDLRRDTKRHDFKVRYAGSSVSEVDWLDAVARAVKSIQGTDLEKVVLARDVHIWSKEAFDIPRLVAGLGSKFPDCYTFAIDGFVGSTPELLVGRDGPSIRSLVLAGTAARGEGTEDQALGRALLESDKEVEEHRLAVGSVVSVLLGICDALDVGDPELLKLANVQHIATKVRGTLTQSLSSLEIASRLHPTAAVCGTPTELALDAIRSLEGLNRGRYAGPVGWMDASGDGEWAIALRCAEISGTRGRLFAGGGIVAGSEPEEELEETRIKLRAMMSVLEG